jgi:hypothetical protein
MPSSLCWGIPLLTTLTLQLCTQADVALLYLLGWIVQEGRHSGAFSYYSEQLLGTFTPHVWLEEHGFILLWPDLPACLHLLSQTRPSSTWGWMNCSCSLKAGSQFLGLLKDFPHNFSFLVISTQNDYNIFSFKKKHRTSHLLLCRPLYFKLLPQCLHFPDLFFLLLNCDQVSILQKASHHPVHPVTSMLSNSPANSVLTLFIHR